MNLFREAKSPALHSNTKGKKSKNKIRPANKAKGIILVLIFAGFDKLFDFNELVLGKVLQKVWRFLGDIIFFGVEIRFVFFVKLQ